MTATTYQKYVRGILVLLQKMVNEKGHGQILITIRDGNIVLIEDRRTRLPENLPET